MGAALPAADRRARLEQALDGAALLGVELEPTYRVLSATIAPVPGRVRMAGGEARLLVVAHPVSTLLAVLVERGPDGNGTLRTFEAAQLPDVVAAFTTARLRAPVLGLPEPRPGVWGPQWSLQGRSSAADGTGETLTLRVADDDLRLDLFARCDVVELRRPDGSSVGDDELHGPGAAAGHDADGAAAGRGA